MLESFIHSIDVPSYAVVGDFNSMIRCVNNKISSKFGKQVIDFCELNSVVLTSQEMLPGDSYTYISDRWGTTSWLDLLLSSPAFHNSVNNLCINYNLSYSDHIPLCFNVCTSTLPCISSSSATSTTCTNKNINWKALSPNQYALYATFTDLICTQSNIENIIPACVDPNCRDSSHVNNLNKAYNECINCLKRSADKVTGVKTHKIYSRSSSKPGWTDYVKEKHNAAIEFYKLWRDNGKPRQGPFFENYKRKKLEYKYAVRAIKRNTERIKADNVAGKLGDNNFRGFWDAVKKFNRSKTVLPQQIGNATGDNDICKMWKTHFHNIYNGVTNSSDDTFHTVKINNHRFTVGHLFTEAQFIIALAKLENNKATGYDGIAAEHIKYSSVLFLQILCKVFNSFLLHGYLPNSFMSVVISPTFKKGGFANDVDSYRPIALANCISKIYEALLRDKLISYLQTNYNQFGYKQKLGTEMCLYAFKEIVDCYNKLDSNIYCCFLDASRAYDRVSHKTLFNMLFERGVPLIFIRILAYWYKYQCLIVKWGNCFSSPFCVTNGVRQGSVLSPYLFCVYVDRISDKLNETKIGCNFRNMIINHLFYADDLCIFSPSSRGLQKLLDVCFNVGSDLNIIFNQKKCKIMVFKSRTYRNCPVPTFNIGGRILKSCATYKYLGHMITESRSDSDDIYRQCRSIYAKGNSLVRTFYKCSDPVKITLFKAYCSSLYTAELWCNYPKYALRKLTVAYHSVFKKLLNYPRNTSNSMLFVYYEVPTFQELLRKNIFGFRNRLTSCENTIVKNIVDCENESSLNTRWNSLLY